MMVQEVRRLSPASGGGGARLRWPKRKGWSMSLTESKIQGLTAIVGNYRLAWESRGSRPASPERRELEFLAALKGDEGFWEDLQAWGGGDAGADFDRIRRLLPSGPAPEISMADLLRPLDLDDGAAGIVLDALRAQRPRDELIREAFAAGKPAEIARLLEAILEKYHPLALIERLFRHFAARPIAASFAGLLLGACVLSGCTEPAVPGVPESAKTAQAAQTEQAAPAAAQPASATAPKSPANRPRPRPEDYRSMTLYKGVTP
jgi:hypothetical protein